MKKRIISLITAIFIAFLSAGTVFAKDNVAEAAEDAIKWMQEFAGENQGGLLSRRDILPVGNSLSDWTALCFALNGVDDDYSGYLNDLKFHIQDCYEKDGYLDRVKATEYHRIILTVYALGGDPETLACDEDGNPINLIADGTYDFHTDPGAQGLNGRIFFLIALDAKNTDVPENAEYTRESVIESILSAQADGGGFGLSEGSSDCDITAMAIQAMAGYYDERDDVREAVDRALEYLSGSMSEDGTFRSFGTDSAETLSQVIIALCCLGRDPADEDMFVKDGRNILQMAMDYRCSDGGFSHTYSNDESDFMTTQQMLLALTSVKLLREDGRNIYDFKDYTGPVIVVEAEESVFPAAAVMIFVTAVLVTGAVITIKFRGKKNV